MHIRRITRILSATTALVTTCKGLPLEPRAADSDALAPRATYAVVPIDGGASRGGSPGSGSGPGWGDAAITVVTTVTSLPVTTRPNAPTDVPIVDIEQQPKTTTKVVYVEQTTSATTSTTSTTSTSTTSTTSATSATSTTTSSSASSVQTTTVETADTSSLPSTVPTTARATTTMPASSSTVSTTTPTIPATTTPPAVLPTIATASTSTTYDDGMWHTFYPPWNGTKLNRRASRPRLW
jgi:hypothetical protein